MTYFSRGTPFKASRRYVCEPYWSATSNRVIPRSSAWRTSRVNSLTPRRVWLLAWFEPWLPVPMPTRETSMPVLPSVTLSVGPLGRLARAARAFAFAEVDAAARAVVATDAWRKSRRFRIGVMGKASRLVRESVDLGTQGNPMSEWHPFYPRPPRAARAGAGARRGKRGPRGRSRLPRGGHRRLARGLVGLDDPFDLRDVADLDEVQVAIEQDDL